MGWSSPGAARRGSVAAMAARFFAPGRFGEDSRRGTSFQLPLFASQAAAFVSTIANRVSQVRAAAGGFGSGFESGFESGFDSGSLSRGQPIARTAPATTTTVIQVQRIRFIVSPLLGSY
jgi:hypothetical protein